MPDLLPGGRVQGRGAGPGRGPVPVGEPGHVPDVGEDLAATAGPTPGNSIKVEPRVWTIALSSLVSALIFFSTANSSTSCSAASRRRVFPDRSRGDPEAGPLVWREVLRTLRRMLMGNYAARAYQGMTT